MSWMSMGICPPSSASALCLADSSASVLLWHTHGSLPLQAMKTAIFVAKLVSHLKDRTCTDSKDRTSPRHASGSSVLQSKLGRQISETGDLRRAEDLPLVVPSHCHSHANLCSMWQSAVTGVAA